MIYFLIALVIWLLMGFVGARLGVIFFEDKYGEGGTSNDMLVMALFMGPITWSLMDNNRRVWKQLLSNRFAPALEGSARERNSISKKRTRLASFAILGMRDKPVYFPQDYSWQVALTDALNT